MTMISKVIINLICVFIILAYTYIFIKIGSKINVLERIGLKSRKNERAQRVEELMFLIILQVSCIFLCGVSYKEMLHTTHSDDIVFLMIRLLGNEEC